MGDSSHFIAAVSGHAEGRVRELCDKLLSDVIGGVRRTGNKGSVTLKLTVEMNGENGLKVTPEAKATVPQPSFGGTFKFSTPDNKLTNDYDEAELELRLTGDEKDPHVVSIHRGRDGDKSA